MILKTDIRKHVKLYFTLAMLIFGLLQCKEEEANPNPPTITILSPAEANPVAYPGKFIQLSFTTTSDAANGANLSSLEVRQQFESNDVVIRLHKTISGSSYNELVDFFVQDEVGTEKWTITVTDDAGNTTEKIITITIEGESPDLAPTLTFTGPPFQNNNFTIEINKQFGFKIIATSNAESGAELNKFVVKKAVGATTPQTLLDLDISGTVFTWDSTFFSNYQPAVETYSFRITDVNGQIIEKTIVATVQQADPGIFVFTGKHVGSNESGVNAGFDTSTGTTYDIASVTQEQEALVDFVFLRTDAYGYSFMSPDYPLIWGPYPAINGWDTKNKTKFKKTTLTVENYNQIVNKNQLILFIQNNIGANGLTINYFSELLSTPGGFAVNDIIAFENPNGDRGLLLVKEIDAGANAALSTIIFDMKVEKP